MAQSRADYLAHHLRGPGALIAAEAHVRLARRRLAGERRTALVGPEPVALPQVLWKLLRRLGLRASATPGPRVACALHWTLATRAAPSQAPGAINGACTDISKRRVQAAMSEAFGYGTAVDPERHEGPCVRKSDENARHDGAVVHGPIAEPEPGAVYERLIDTAAGGRLEELRIPIVAGAVPFLYVKHRPVADRFGHGPSRARMAPATDFTEPDELAALLAGCSALGLDLGEIDALRDRRDGRLYVVDVNRTPWGPPRALGARGARLAVGRLADAFAGAWLEH